MTGLAVSLKAEQHLETLLAVEKGNTTNTRSSSDSHARQQPQYGLQYQHREGDDQEVPGATPASAARDGPGDEEPEEKALGMAIEEIWEESGKQWRPWAANGKAIRIGEMILLVDSDTVVPEDCLRDAAREMYECPDVAIIQHESG
jgi:hypothetical protein